MVRRVFSKVNNIIYKRISINKGKIKFLVLA